MKLFLFVFLLIHFKAQALFLNSTNNVCYSILDYATIRLNWKNCWFNPDVGSTTRDIVIRHGYPFESYSVTTEDGYILNLFRIPPPIGSESNAQPVFLQHGIATSSVVWVDIGDRSLAFQLANLGYDVWMSNTRGTRYSVGHVNLTTDQKEYYNYSFHEMGIYDIPAELDFIAKTTGKAGSIIYIGHSMGTTQSYVYATLRADNARKNVIGFLSLSPVAFMANVQSSAVLLVPFREQIKNLLASVGLYALGQFAELQEENARNTCDLFSQMKVCRLLYFQAFGYDYIQFQPQDIPIAFTNFMSTASVKSLDHYAQIIASGGRFQYYDYGLDENIIRYNSSIPPLYPVQDITLPVHLFYGRNDYLAGETDVTILYDTLTAEKSITPIAADDSVRFNHMDFMYAKDIVQLLYRPMFEVIRKLVPQ